MSDKSGPKPGHFLPGGASEALTDETIKAGTPNEAAPKPGHFLPGGTGEASVTTAPKPEMAKPQAGLTPLAAPTPRLGPGAETPTGPPQLHGSRLGPPPPGDPAAAAFKARYHPDPIPFQPRKRSKGLIAAIVVGALLLGGGGVAAATKVLSSYDDFVANPLGTPSPKPIGVPTDAEPDADPVSDTVVTQENKLYANGKLAPVKCREPQFRPTSKENVRSYYEALLTCLNTAWEPVVRKAGYEFKAPQLIIFDDGQETACGVQEQVSSYCDANGGSVALPWQDLQDEYSKNAALARIDMADALSYVYGVHLANLTGIFAASRNLRDEAPSEAAAQEIDRRLSLQATCLSSIFLSAAKGTFPVRGGLLNAWKWRSTHSGDELTTGSVRDHGSRKSVQFWMTRGFSTMNPGSCNTFVAAATKVS